MAWLRVFREVQQCLVLVGVGVFVLNELRRFLEGLVDLIQRDLAPLGWCFEVL